MTDKDLLLIPELIQPAGSSPNAEFAIDPDGASCFCVSIHALRDEIIAGTAWKRYGDFLGFFATDIASITHFASGSAAIRSMAQISEVAPGACSEPVLDSSTMEDVISALSTPPQAFTLCYRDGSFLCVLPVLSKSGRTIAESYNSYGEFGGILPLTPDGIPMILYGERFAQRIALRRMLDANTQI